MRAGAARVLLIPSLALLAVGAWPQPAAAQRRIRPAPRVVVHRVYRPVVYDPWFTYGWGIGYPYPYQWGYPYPPYGYARYDDLTASVRLEVTPNAAEVYVDGFRAGTVDDFDGFFQRLHLRPGEHEIVLYLDGYRSVRQTLYLNARSDQKIRYTMVPLPAGEAQDPRPQPAASAEQSEFQPDAPRPPRAGGPGRGGPPPRGPVRPAPAGQYGSVAIRVQPADAEVLIDGEPWQAPEGQERLVVQLPGGRHHVEIRKDDFETYASDIDVRAGESLPLNVSLLRRQP